MQITRVFLIPGVRERVAKARFLVKRRLHGFSVSEDSSYVSLVEYSRSHFYEYQSIRERIDFLVSTLGNTTRIDCNTKLLVLGPRYESEIFGYMGLGFRKRNIYALDTFSYSKLITLGNLHNMPYRSEQYDIVVCGWTLAYSQDLSKAIDEICRVLKLGGMLIMTFDLREKEEVCNLAELEIANYKGPLMKLLERHFRVRNYFVGRTSWAKLNICSLALEKR
jgi:SAM-dependent methyltransferase